MTRGKPIPVGPTEGRPDMGSDNCVNFSRVKRALTAVFIALASCQVLLAATHHITLANGKSFDLDLPDGFGISIAAQGLKRVRFMARSPDDRIVRVDLPCSPCNRIRLPPARCVGHTPDCLQSITVNDVYSAAAAVLERAARSGILPVRLLPND